MKLRVSKTQPCIGSLVVAELAKSQLPVEVSWVTGQNELDAGLLIALNTDANIARFFARSCPQLNLYGSDAQSKTEIDHWLCFTLGPLKYEFDEAISYLDSVLKPITVLVGDKLTIADFVIAGALQLSGFWQGLLQSGKAPTNVLRWFEYVSSQAEVAKVLKSLPPESKAKPVTQSAKTVAGSGNNGPAKQTKDEGKFVDLPNAEMGKVVVRFPPEASGYLHIGHAKAALLNQHYRDHFQGKLILRFDDTNPAKEKEEFEEVILEDMKMLKIKYDHFSRTSDHFETMLGYCEKLLKEGKAYVDDTDADTMKAQREAREESKNRNNPVAKNLQLWEEMKQGTAIGLKCAVRAKIDMKCDNGCMRDPTIYRCKLESHPATKDKFKVYPTYDFACPIVDSIEGVTHALRTTEYMDRDDQYHWFIEACGLRKPTIYAYARLNLTNTVMSKRKLTWFVDSGNVEGWDDPRFPTVRGVIRRGLTIEALKQFILAQGSSRSVVFMEWDKIWAMNKKVIDPIAPRYTTVDKSYNVPVNISGVAGFEAFKADLHPKNPEVGTKVVWRSPKVLIDGVDAETLQEGENATFINWGNIRIKKVNKQNGKVVSVDAEANLDDKDFKKTVKLTWLGVVEDKPESDFIPTTVIYYDHIISKPVLDKDDDFKNFIGKETKIEVEMLGDPEFRKLKKGDIVQIQRRGFFIVDSPYKDPTPHSCKPANIRLIAIPDGTPSSYGPPGKVVAAPPAQPSKGGKSKTAAPAKVENKTAAAPANVNASASGDELNDSIAKQGEKVRQLKADKTDKASIDAAVAVLLDLKAKYKAATGKDWKPGAQPTKAAAPAKATEQPKQTSGPAVGDDLNNSIVAQGDKVRQLKAEKADKATVDAAVASLLDLKAKYKAATGNDWKPGAHPTKAAAPTKAAEQPKQSSGPAAAGDDLNNSIVAQGDKVRQLKAEKADKAAIDAAVASLLDLKAKYKAATGNDWKPGAQPAKVEKAPAKPAEQSKQESNPVADQLSNDIVAQGDKVRQLKAEKADKVAIDTAVNVLLGLKTKYKTLTGNDWKPAAGNPEPKSAKKPKEEKPKATKQEKKPAVAAATADGAAGQKQTRLGLEARKEDSLADWYSQVITKAEMLEYYDVSGCYILRPWAYSIWERIQAFFDGEIKKLGVQNCYFPIFVSQAALQKEKDHIADFAPEVAWVTRSGDSELSEPIAIRPTSETVMYPAYAKWIQSYRDLPIKLNQWNNVVRWEFKHPQPFLRTREFLWQEGHTAFASQQEAKEEVLVILDLYRQIYEDLLAIPVVRGRKTEKEKFAGGDYTTTVEAYIASAGRAIQGATSHHLGQNFSKMFELVYDHPETNEKCYVYQNSWGITTRTLGVLTMVHGDNKGLVLPPKVSNIQVVIVPCGITVSLKEEERTGLYAACKEYEDSLVNAGVRVKGDYRENYSPGWKFNHWELKGVPIRLEVGPRDVKSGQYVAVRRDSGEKVTLLKASCVQDIKKLLDDIQASLFARAKKELDDNLSVVTEWKDFLSSLDKNHLIQAPFCGDIECEEQIKEMSKADSDLEPGAPSMGAKSLCIPFQQPAQITASNKCIRSECKLPPKNYTMFGRSY